MNSTFPQKIDNIPTFLDVESKDGNLIKQFENYMQKNDFANANLILQRIENSDRKIITASRLNQLRSCIIKLEEFYSQNIFPYVNEKQNQWQSIINQFKFIGNYSSSTQYEINNIVTYFYEGDYNLYIRTSGNKVSNKPPTDTNYWRKLTIKGERGISETGQTTFYFEWNKSQTYPTNSIVSYNNQWWISKRQNINSEPIEGNSNWEVVMTTMQTIYPVSSNMPTGQAIGEIWFEVINNV